MGNLCGKASKEDHFAGPGRTLSSAPPPRSDNARATIPATATANKTKPMGQGQSQTVGGKGRTLGGATDGAGEEDPKARAARAAEERAQAAQGKGAMGRKLDAQKKQTDRAALEQAARENRMARDADAVQEARNWN